MNPVFISIVTSCVISSFSAYSALCRYKSSPSPATLHSLKSRLKSQVSSRLPSSLSSKYSTCYLLSEYSSTLWGTIRILSLQMAFAARFNEVTTDITHISELEVNMKYPVERADRITTRFGDTVLSIRDTAADRLHKVFLPQRHGAALKEEDIQSIKEGTVDLSLVSKGKCPKTNAYQLAVE